MWGGLLATSCSESDADEGNLIFMTLLSQLTASQAKVLDYAAAKAQKQIGENV
jgi:hypothetical protein